MDEITKEFPTGETQLSKLTRTLMGLKITYTASSGTNAGQPQVFDEEKYIKSALSIRSPELTIVPITSELSKDNIISLVKAARADALKSITEETALTKKSDIQREIEGKYDRAVDFLERGRPETSSLNAVIGEIVSRAKRKNNTLRLRETSSDTKEKCMRVADSKDALVNRLLNYVTDHAVEWAKGPQKNQTNQ